MNRIPIHNLLLAFLQSSKFDTLKIAPDYQQLMQEMKADTDKMREACLQNAQATDSIALISQASLCWPFLP